MIRCSCTVVVRRLEASLIGGLAQVRTEDHWWIDTVYLPYLETAVSTDGKPANLALSAGLGAYLAALHYHPLWLSEGETGGIAVRKAGLRSLRECIVEAYIQGAEAAGWPQKLLPPQGCVPVDLVWRTVCPFLKWLTASSCMPSSCA